MKVELKGVVSVTSKGKLYHYAWRGGPRLQGKPGSPEFMAGYHAALETRRTQDDGRMRALVSIYRSSSAFTDLAETTRRIWGRWLDRIVVRFGEYPVAFFDRPDKVRPIIRRWRETWINKPRSADYAIQVLSRVLSHAMDLDKISTNPCDGFKSLYKNDRADIIWSEEDLAAIKAVASPEVWWAINLAAHTGLRAGDLTALSWSHIGKEAIVIPTGKSRGAKDAFVPLYDDLRTVLSEIPKRATTVLTNAKGRPWRDGVNGTSFRAARDTALPDRDLHFHDLRGTAATRFHNAGLSNRDIAEIMAWEEGQVDRIIRRYVGRSAVTQSIVQKLKRAGGQTEP